MTTKEAEQQLIGAKHPRNVEPPLVKFKGGIRAGEDRLKAALQHTASVSRNFGFVGVQASAWLAAHF